MVLGILWVRKWSPGIETPPRRGATQLSLSPTELWWKQVKYEEGESECCRCSTREATSSTAARTPCRTPPTAARVWTATPGRPQVRWELWCCVDNSDLGAENGKTFVKPCTLYTFQTFSSSDTRRSMPNLNKMRGGRGGNHPAASTNPAYGLSQVGLIFDQVK